MNFMRQPCVGLLFAKTGPTLTLNIFFDVTRVTPDTNTDFSNESSRRVSVILVVVGSGLLAIVQRLKLVRGSLAGSCSPPDRWLLKG
jgi:hypothetical protein